MLHLFLSPHADDAVLSCGGLIAQLTGAGETVSIFTLTAGDLPGGVPLNPFIAEHVLRWGLGDNPAPGRQAEDRRAAAVVGATVQFGTLPDALYRRDRAGRWLYPDLTRLFGDIAPTDPARAEAHTWLPRLEAADVLYVPLGAGHHVDHLLVREIALSWWQQHPQVAVFFFEEYPYSADGADVVQAAVATLGVPVSPALHPISPAALQAKCDAITCYTSQLSTFWDDVPAMTAAVQHYAAQVGGGTYAERLWQPD